MAQNVKTALRELIQTYRDSLLLPTPSAVDPSKGGLAGNGGLAPGKGKGGHGTHGQRSAHLAFGDDVPFPVRMERWLQGAAAYWRHQLEREQKGVEKAGLPEELVELASALNGIASSRQDGRHGGDRKSGAKRAEDRQVLATKGDSIVVGLLFGRSAESVRRLRERAGQDPHTGEHVRKPAPLTSRELPEEE